jgi:putative alpha-1,2-mannosidase
MNRSAFHLAHFQANCTNDTDFKMTKRTLIILLGLAIQTPSQAGNLLDYVNILQGTDSKGDLSHGNTLPLVGAPWGMIDWSMENGEGSWYFQPNGTIDGFRATHQPSPWISDYGQFVLMPQGGELQMEAKARRST